MQNYDEEKAKGVVELEGKIDQFEDELNLGDLTTRSMPDLMLRTTTLLEGGVDAAILPDPLAAFAVAEGANIVIDDTKLGENLSQSVVVVTKENIEKIKDLKVDYISSGALTHSSPILDVSLKNLHPID